MSDPVFAMWTVLLCIVYLFAGPQWFARKPASIIVLILGTLIATWIGALLLVALRALIVKLGWSL